MCWQDEHGHHELFSSAVFKNDPRPAYPAIDESDLGLYEYVRNYQGDQFIQHDRPEHLEMRKVVHGYFTPKSLEEWRPFVQKAVKHLLDEAEKNGRMDVMRDLATPLPVLVIAEMMGVPEPDRPYIRELAEKLLYIGRGEHDRMPILTDGMKGMIEYVSPLVDERIVNPGNDFISVLASGEKAGVFTRHQVLVNTSLLLLAGHETTINLLCNGTLAFINHPLCVGNAMCETFAPNAFRLNDNRQSEAVDPAGDPEEKILEAAENCPMSAIFVEDADTGERLFP